MKWMRFRVRTRTEAEDILISFMEDIGLSGAQIEDNVPLTAAEKEQMFVDILPEGPADDGTAVLSFFLEETEDGKLVVDETLQTPLFIWGKGIKRGHHIDIPTCEMDVTATLAKLLRVEPLPYWTGRPVDEIFE